MHRELRRLAGGAELSLAEGDNIAYIDAMRKIAVVVPLLVLLAASIWFAYYVWTTDEGPPMPVSGYIAMALGILFSLLIGFGLMALVFYSHRHGYDEPAQTAAERD